MVGPHWEAITILVGYSDNISAVIVAKDTEESQSGNWANQWGEYLQMEEQGLHLPTENIKNTHNCGSAVCWIDCKHKRGGEILGDKIGHQTDILAADQIRVWEC